MPAEQLRQLGGHADESESRRAARLELDQYVDIALPARNPPATRTRRWRV